MQQATYSVQQATYSVHLHAANSSAFCCKRAACARGEGPHVFWLVWKMESDEKVLQACAAIVVADALLEKPEQKRKKRVNDYLLERMTKGSYGGLLTELSF